MMWAMVAMAPDAPLRIFAAVSLREVVTEMARIYEREHPGVKVRASFAGSQTLSAQISHGAPADLFVSAARKNLLDAGVDASTIRVVARNRLTVVLGNKAPRLTSVRELITLKRIVLADEKVPAGRYSAVFLDKAAKVYGDPWLLKFQERVVSRELDVRTVLTRVRFGEADAGIVYVTDAKTAKHLDALPIPKELNVFAEYAAAIPKGAPNREGGRAFLDLLTSKSGQRTFDKYGFLPAQEK